MLTFIGEMKRNMNIDTIKRRRNKMAMSRGWGPLAHHTLETVGTGPSGGTRKKKAQKKRRASRKSFN